MLGGLFYIKELEQREKINIKRVSGCSIGAVLGLLFILSWLTVAIISRYSSLSSNISLIIIPFISFYFFNIITINALIFIISFFIILKHYSNILRLLNKTENKIRF